MKQSLWTLQGFGSPYGNNTLKSMTQVESSIYLYLESLIINKYKYEGAPEEFEQELFEDMLFWRGSAICFTYPTTGVYMLLPYSGTGNLDVYGRFQYGHPMSLNGAKMPLKLRFRKDLIGNEKQDAVLWMNNIDCTSTYGLIKPFVDQFIYIMQTKMLNCAMSRKPVVIKGNKKNAAALNLQFKSIFGQGITPFSVAYDSTDLSSVLEVLDLHVKYDQAAYWDDLKNTWNQILTLCGIGNNENIAKKERLITTESQGNDEDVAGERMGTFAFRQKACKEMNRVFGLNMKVKYIYDNYEETTGEPEPEPQPQFINEGDENHDN